MSQLQAFAKRLRRDMTDAERRLWSGLRGHRLHGLKFKRQEPIEHYIADFVCFDLSSLAFQPQVRVADAVLYSATRANACDVWTSGRRAVSDGRLLAFDEQEISALARQWAERLRLEMPL